MIKQLTATKLMRACSLYGRNKVYDPKRVGGTPPPGGFYDPPAQSLNDKQLTRLNGLAGSVKAFSRSRSETRGHCDGEQGFFYCKSVTDHSNDFPEITGTPLARDPWKGNNGVLTASSTRLITECLVILRGRIPLSRGSIGFASLCHARG